jgi:lipopolysaccharide transport system permease protein
MRDLQSEVKGSLLGLFWLILNPLLMLAVYACVFGGIFGARFDAGSQSGPEDYVLGLFLGLSIHQFLASIFMMTPRLVYQNPDYVKKMVFPLEVLPVSRVYTATVHFAISISLLIVAMAFFGYRPGLECLLLPLCFGPLFLIAFGLAFFLSGIGVFFRDLPQICVFLTTVLLYASGVFYAADTVEQDFPNIWVWLEWNPILHIIDLSRKTLLWGVTPDFTTIMYLWLTGFTAYLFGLAVFRILRKTFADVV